MRSEAAGRTGGAGSTRRRLAAHGLRPNLELGQNFLDDGNLLGVIERAAELDPARDTVLEVGGGLGTLSEHLAPRVKHLHVVEVDRRLAPALVEALEGHGNTTLHLEDAVRLDLAALDPPPGKLVANLPYGVAATVVLRTVQELPEMHLWVAMVQREVAERLAALPDSRTYGATSVIAQLACEARVLRRIGPTVFHPRPHVESALLRLRRIAPPPDRATVALVHAAFAHRRKALARSLALVAGDGADLRERVRRELEGLGHPADARAERLPPECFQALAGALGEEALAPLGGRRAVA